MVPKVLKHLFTVLLILFCLNEAQAGNRIFWLESYHQGYPWTDTIDKAINEALNGKNVELKVFHMDTKRHDDEDSIVKAAKKAVDEIHAFHPDVVIASDDNAAKYVIVPFFKNDLLPFVFCGINQSVERYGFPWPNVTGIIEMDPVDKLIYALSRFHSINKVGLLTEDGTTARVNGYFYKTQTRFNCIEYYVKSFDEWKKSYIRAQNEVDVLIIGPTSGIKSWDDNKALETVYNQTKIPTGCLQNYLTALTLIGCLKLPEEQGRWAAETALKILEGIPVKRFPIAIPKEYKFIVNKRIAKTLGIDIPKSYLEKADMIIN